MRTKGNITTVGNILKSQTLIKRIVKSRFYLFMLAPVLVYYIIFHYIPMYGATIAFKDFYPLEGILGSPWVGFKHFNYIFKSVYFWRLVKNTFLISFYSIIFGFPVPIIFALLLNELKNGLYKRTIQTVSYLPHFISTVVIVGMVVNFLSPVDGIVNHSIVMLGGKPINFMNSPRWFRTIYIGSGIWQGFGWGSIIYLAALSGIDPELYEAAVVDGASRLQRIFHISIPGILSTIIILLILRFGQLMSVGAEKILLMYNPTTYEVADVIQTYVYRRGILGADFSFATAVGLFNSAVNFIMLIVVNRVSKKVSSISLW